MKNLFLIYLVALSFNVSAWTLSRSARSGFVTTTSVNVYIGSNSCANAGLTANEIKTFAEEAVSEFWNSVPTSALKLNIVGVDSSLTLTDSDDLTDAVNMVPTNSIFIGCNANASVFTSTNILAVGNMACNGNDCAGAVIVNNISGTVMGSADNQTIKSTMAHELGHAIGIGHTSVKYALMYYDATGLTNKSLSQDDIDAVSYLYPNSKKLGGLAGSCSTVVNSKGNQKDSFMAFILGLLGIFGLYSLGNFLKKRA